jgi:dipeptidase D
MASAFDGLKPELVWRHFAALTRIPRCSKHEEAAARYVLDWAREKGFEARRDATGNVYVAVPASVGLEGAPAVVLQAHLDMVCEKDSGSKHDLATDPLTVVREGDYITAQGTSLGADNGVGVAAAVAVAEDEGARHGPLELLLTLDEETGLTGAQGVDATFLRGRMLLNLDSEEDDALYVGCAGGADTLIALPVERAAAESGEWRRFQLRVAGLHGGHSGLDINTGRGNAVKLLAGVLGRLRRVVDFGLLDWAGGDKHNAIPREAHADLLLPVAAAADEAVAELLAAARRDLRTAFGQCDPGVALEWEEVAPADGAPADGGAGSAVTPLTREARDRCIDLVLALPHGVLAMSQAVPGLTESSTNLAVLGLQVAGGAPAAGADGAAAELAAVVGGEPRGEWLLVKQSSRSSVMPALRAVEEGLLALARLAGARALAHNGYPGWQPNPQSHLLARGLAVYEQLFDRAPEVKAVHAGLECGLIGECFSGEMDMLSFGPNIHDPHSPSERVEIASMGRFYRFLKGLLEELARPR